MYLNRSVHFAILKVCQIYPLYTLNSHHVICQFHLKKHFSAPSSGLGSWRKGSGSPAATAPLAGPTQALQAGEGSVPGSRATVQSLSRVRLFVTPWIAARQASLSITNSQSLLKLMSIELVMPSNHLMLCRPHLLLPPIPPSSRVFSNGQLFASGDQSIGVSASVLPWTPRTDLL